MISLKEPRVNQVNYSSVSFRKSMSLIDVDVKQTLVLNYRPPNHARVLVFGKNAKIFSHYDVEVNESSTLKAYSSSSVRADMEVQITQKESGNS